MKTWLLALAILLVTLAVAGNALYAWAVRNQSVATLDWIDACFSRDAEVGPPVEGRYGNHAQQKLFVYRPVGADNPPLVVFLHGGGWRTGDPADYAFVPAVSHRRAMPRLSSATVSARQVDFLRCWKIALRRSVGW